MAEDLGAAIVVLPGNAVAAEITRYAREHNVDQLLIVHSTEGRWTALLHGSVVRQVLQANAGIDVHVIGDNGMG